MLRENADHFNSPAGEIENFVFKLMKQNTEALAAVIEYSAIHSVGRSLTIQTTDDIL